MKDMNLIYERLGFRPRIQNRFYAKDLAQFYQVMSSGKSDKEEDLIRQSILILMEYLESQRLASWEVCDEPFWKKLFAFSYLDLSYEQSLEQAKGFFQTIPEFVEWLENTYHYGLPSSEVGIYVRRIEEEVIEAVRFLDVYQQKIENPFGSGLAEISRDALLQQAGQTPVTEGVFQITSFSERTMTVEALMTRQSYLTKVPSQLQEVIHEDMSLIGVLKKTATDEWEILVLDRVFPPAALVFLKQALGLE